MTVSNGTISGSLGYCFLLLHYLYVQMCKELKWCGRTSVWVSTHRESERYHTLESQRSVTRSLVWIVCAFVWMHWFHDFSLPLPSFLFLPLLLDWCVSALFFIWAHILTHPFCTSGSIHSKLKFHCVAHLSYDLHTMATNIFWFKSEYIVYQRLIVSNERKETENETVSAEQVRSYVQKILLLNQTKHYIHIGIKFISFNQKHTTRTVFFFSLQYQTKKRITPSQNDAFRTASFLYLIR